MADIITTDDIYKAASRILKTSDFNEKDYEILERTQQPPSQYIKELRLAFNISKGKEAEILELAKSNSAKKKVRAINGFMHLENYVDNTEHFHEIQPFFYDDVGAFWFWQEHDKRWQLVDEIDIMNAFDHSMGLRGQTITTGIKRNYLEAFKRVGRQKRPKDAPKELIQFKDKAFNIETGELIEATPEYWFCNPIPWELGTTADTPVLDKLFREWVGQRYVKTLYEIIAYSCYTDYPIQLLFCLYGMGRNGKSCFLKLITNFFGLDNTSSTELDLLTGPQSSRFESIKLYKKLVCLLGETNFESLSRSSVLKKLTGGDQIGYEMKGKTPFNGYNYAKIIIASNSLPITEDTSEGFYRRWLIIDFPNEFPEGKDIIKTIPDSEYRALAKKVSGILPELIMRGEFSNQGRIADRKQKYIESSNPLSLFIAEYCQEDQTGYIHYSEFFSKYVTYLKRLRRRVISRREFSKVIAQEGYDVRKTSKKVGDEFVNGLWIEGYSFKGNGSTGNVGGSDVVSNEVIVEEVLDENDDCARCARCAVSYPPYIRARAEGVFLAQRAQRAQNDPKVSQDRIPVSEKPQHRQTIKIQTKQQSIYSSQESEEKIMKNPEKTDSVTKKTNIISTGKEGMSVFEKVINFIGNTEKSIEEIEQIIPIGHKYTADTIIRKLKKDGDIFMTKNRMYKVLQ